MAQPTGLCQSSPTSASRQRRESARRARGRHATRLPACVAWPPRRLAPSPRRRLDPLEPSRSLPRPHLLPWLSPSHAPERSRRHRRAPPWPQPLPCPVVAPRGSASTPSSSPPSHEVPDALQRRRHRRFHRRPPKLIAADSGATGRPRPRPRAPWTRCERLHLTPLTPLPLAHRSRRPLAARSTPPAELAVNVAPVTIWSPRRA